MIKNSATDTTNCPKNESNDLLNMEFIVKLEKTIFYLNEKNFDYNYPYTLNKVIFILVYYAFVSQRNPCNLYFKYLKTIQTKEFEINKSNPNIIDIFSKHINSKIESQESYYLLSKMIEENLVTSNITRNINTKYFAQYKNEIENKRKNHADVKLLCCRRQKSNPI